ncbi:MAG: GNAT family N-acetyltransferase [Thermomicrobiales bacterium]
MTVCPTIIRRAVAADVPAIVAMLADDPLGAKRESVDDMAPYQRAFEQIDRDPSHLLVVMERSHCIIGTMQLSFLPGLSRQGATRALVEAVRVSSAERGGGLGKQLMQWAIDESRARGCTMMQLTSDLSRTDAHRFYLNLGFEQSHAGFKLTL